MSWAKKDRNTKKMNPNLTQDKNMGVSTMCPVVSPSCYIRCKIILEKKIQIKYRNIRRRAFDMNIASRGPILNPESQTMYIGLQSKNANRQQLISLHSIL